MDAVKVKVIPHHVAVLLVRGRSPAGWLWVDGFDVFAVPFVEHMNGQAMLFGTCQRVRFVIAVFRFADLKVVFVQEHNAPPVVSVSVKNVAFDWRVDHLLGPFVLTPPSYSQREMASITFFPHSAKILLANISVARVWCAHDCTRETEEMG